MCKLSTELNANNKPLFLHGFITNPDGCYIYNSPNENDKSNVHIERFAVIMVMEKDKNWYKIDFDGEKFVKNEDAVILVSPFNIFSAMTKLKNDKLIPGSATWGDFINCSEKIGQVIIDLSISASEKSKINKCYSYNRALSILSSNKIITDMRYWKDFKDKKIVRTLFINAASSILNKKKERA